MHESASESLQSKLEKSHPLSCGCHKKNRHPTGARIRSNRRTIPRFWLHQSDLKTRASAQTEVGVKARGRSAVITKPRSKMDNLLFTDCFAVALTPCCYQLPAGMSCVSGSSCLPLFAYPKQPWSIPTTFPPAGAPCTPHTSLLAPCGVAKHKQPGQENYCRECQPRKGCKIKYLEKKKEQRAQMKVTLGSTCAHLGNAGVTTAPRTCMLIWMSYVNIGAQIGATDGQKGIAHERTIRSEKTNAVFLSCAVAFESLLEREKLKKNPKKQKNNGSCFQTGCCHLPLGAERSDFCCSGDR